VFSPFYISVLLLRTPCASTYFLVFVSVLLFVSFPNTLLSVFSKFSIVFPILLNLLPCRGFVKKSANMFVVGQNATISASVELLVFNFYAGCCVHHCFSKKL